MEMTAAEMCRKEAKMGWELSWNGPFLMLQVWREGRWVMAWNYPFGVYVVLPLAARGGEG